MQIDRRNFAEHIDLVLDEIKRSQFVAFDCQFTGLVTQILRIEGMFPNHVEFYERIRETALNFKILQLGITVFLYENGEYIPKAYNFYVKPINCEHNFNNVMVCEVQSLQFLAKNSMDFARVFKYGIHSKRIEGEEKEQYKAYYDYSEDQNVFFGVEDQKIIDELEVSLSKSVGQIRLDFHTKKIMEYLRKNYDMSLDKPKKNMGRYEYYVKVYRRNANDEIYFQEEKKVGKAQEAENTQIILSKSQVSFQKNQQVKRYTLEEVIKQIIEYQKPIVGHFPNLDIGLIYNSFIGPIPQTYEEFTTKINGLFPFIFDTKIISRRLQNKLKNIKVDLKSLYKACFNKKLLQPFTNINFKHVAEYIDQQSSHQAGYDSFMTGCAFIGMANYLLEGKGPIVFQALKEINKIMYSKFAGEISLAPPVYCEKSEYYQKRILIDPRSKKSYDWKGVAELLSKYGTLTVYEDRDETYFFFEEQQNIEEILESLNIGLKNYDQRKIIRGRKMYVN